jgi:hypothetical protein
MPSDFQFQRTGTTGFVRGNDFSQPSGWGQIAEVDLVRVQAGSAICPQRIDLRSKRWGQIVVQALLTFRITTDNLTPATPVHAKVH